MPGCPSRYEYLIFFRSSAWLATAPAAKVDCARRDGAYVSEQVASQTKRFPFFHGTMVIPSGRFPSERSRPVGSSLDGMWEVVRARWIISFIIIIIIIQHMCALK